MTEMYKIRDDVHDAVNGFNQVNIGDEVNTMWGYQELTLSVSDITHLLHGGCLYTSDGEYATVIALEREALKEIKEC